MKEVTIGLVPAPGISTDLIENLTDDLQDLIGTIIDEEVTWQIDFKTHILTSSAEYINETLEKVEDIKKDNEWDIAIAVSDLPSISEKKVVLSEFNYDKNISLISVPSLGFFQLRKKLQNLLIHHIEVLYANGQSEDTGWVKTKFMGRITEVTPQEDSGSSNRYIHKSTVSGRARLLSGMTFLNEPWTEITNFKTIVALAFATGTYISIFATPWELSLDYSLWRFIVLMFIAIFGMTVWLIYAHGLWEMASAKNQPVYRHLYNFTTLATLLSITIVNYIIVSLLLTISIVIFVPMGLFETWTETDPDVKRVDYVNLIWFTSSVGVLAGALGSTVEEEEKIRNVTYSYRQMHRYRQIEKEKEEASKSQKDDEHPGEEQSHDESEEGK